MDYVVQVARGGWVREDHVFRERADAIVAAVQNGKPGAPAFVFEQAPDGRRREIGVAEGGRFLARSPHHAAGSAGKRPRKTAAEKCEAEEAARDARIREAARDEFRRRIHQAMRQGILTDPERRMHFYREMRARVAKAKTQTFRKLAEMYGEAEATFRSTIAAEEAAYVHDLDRDRTPFLIG